MSLTVYLDCNVERVWAFPGVFALNFSVSVDISNATPAERTKAALQPFIHPWMWNWADNNGVAIWPTSARPARSVNGQTLSMPVLRDLDNVKNAYSAYVDALAFDNRSTVIGDFFEVLDTHTSVQDCKARLAVYTADIATRPAAVQQNLGFSRYFKIQSPGAWANSNDWFAAPIFTGPPFTASSVMASPVGTGPVFPTAPPAGQIALPPRWKYTGSSVSIVARLHPIAALPTSILVANTSWILAKSSSFVYNSEPAHKAVILNTAIQALNTPRLMLNAVAGMEHEFDRQEFVTVLGHAGLTSGSSIPQSNLPRISQFPTQRERNLAVARALLANPTANAAIVSPAAPLTAADVDRLKREVQSGNLHRNLVQSPPTAAAAAIVSSGAMARLAARAVAGPEPPTFLRTFTAIAGNPNLLQSFRTAIHQFHRDTFSAAGANLSPGTPFARLLNRIAPAPPAAPPSTAAARMHALDRAGRPPIFIPPYKPTSTAHSFAVPVSDAATLNIGETAKLLSGFGLVVRVATLASGAAPGSQRGPNPVAMTPWRVTNLGRIYFHPIAGAPLSAAPIVPAAVLPLRPQLSAAIDTLSQTLYYDAKPMAAEHALSDIASATPFNGQMDGSTDCPVVQREAVLHYQSVYPSPDWTFTDPEKWAIHQPALKFGCVVEGAVFGLQNSGALPSVLGISSDPGELQAFDPAFMAPDAAVHRELYLRRVPVGPLEIVNTPEPFLTSDSTILPLSPELDRDVLAVPDTRIYYGAAPERALPDESPEALLQSVLPGIGTLDLTDGNQNSPHALDWSLSLDSVDLRKIGDNSTFIVRIEWNDVPPPDPLQEPTFAGYIEANIANSTVQVKSNDSAVGSPQPLPSKLFDLRIELTGTTLRVNIAPRQFFFTPETRTAPTVIPVDLGTWIAPQRARLRVFTTVASGSGDTAFAGFRRPTIQFSKQASATVPESRPIEYLLATGGLGVSASSANVPAQCTLSLRLPSTDIATWDRWTSWTMQTTQDRIDGWADFYRQGVTDNARKALLEDPAVTSIRVEAVPLYGTGARGQTWLKTTFAKSAHLNARSAPVDFQITTAQAPGGDPPPNTHFVKAGEIWELRFYCAVPDIEFRVNNGGRIHPRMSDDARRHDNLVLLSPLIVRVEVAALPVWPDPQVLQNMLVMAHTSSAVTVSLDRTVVQSDPDTFWSRVKLATIRVQEWRWLGRPLQKDPFTANPGTWEMSGAFNGRDREDARFVDSQLSLYNSSPQIFVQDIATDLRALYFRYQLSLNARFAALSIDASAAFRQSPPDLWSHDLIPCRQTEPPSKPVVRLVVPLTQSAEWQSNPDQDRSPGALVLVAERWFGFGGFIEKLCFDILPTKEEDIRARQDLQEIGYDPRLTIDAITSYPPFDPPDGPIGNTLDLDVQTPLFRACSFIVRLPAAYCAHYAPMARLRFWRELSASGMASGTKLVSDKTPPFNVQFLPEPARFFGSHDFADYNIQISAGAKAVRFLKKDGTDAPIVVPPPETVIFVVLNRVILDAFSQEQEEFVALYAQSASIPALFDNLITAHPDPIDLKSVYRGRLIEIEQVNVNSSTATDNFRSSAIQDVTHNETDEAFFWRRTFANTSNDATLRIMGISCAIETLQSVAGAKVN